jgi:hypothetical protein
MPGSGSDDQVIECDFGSVVEADCVLCSVESNDFAEDDLDVFARNEVFA